MPLPKKRVAVVGGGPAGIAAVYWLKEYGLEPICYEKTTHFGGTWNYHEEPLEGVASIMSTTTSIHSKEMGALSGFPPMKEYPNYMKHNYVLEMSWEWAREHDLLRHILYNHEVERVSKAEDYEETGRWMVKVRNHENGEISEDAFEGVLVCVGHVTYPKMPTFPGIEEYRGKVLHTHSLKKFEEFKNQNVVVVGVGCSALDAAVEISAVARQVYLSTRSGVWILPRVGPGGLPIDWVFYRRHIVFFIDHLPLSFTSSIIEKLFLSTKFNHTLYNLKPKYHLLSQDPSVNDFLSAKIITGDVIVKRNIKYFTHEGVFFEGDGNVTKADTVIMATGYTWKFPFLDEGILTTESDGRINLYKCMYPPQLSHSTLAIIGFLQPFGPTFPLVEIQCRWASHLLSGQGSLPCKDVMMTEVKMRHEQNLKRYTPSDKMSIRVDFISYLDNIASEIGAKPNFLKMAFRDPQLFTACIFGPCLPYQYRLEGPHSWPGAREAILTASDRMRKPLSENDRPTANLISNSSIAKYWLALLIMLLFLFLINSHVKYYLIAMFLLLPLLWKNLEFKHFVLWLYCNFLIW